MLKTATIILLTSTLLLASNPKKEVNQELKEVKKIGKMASKQLLERLVKELKKSIKTNGFGKTIDFCSSKAIPITHEIDEKLGKDISIKRISLRYRNNGNQPNENEEKILKNLEELNKLGIKLTPLIQKTNSGYRYIKPLVINKKVCLNCHGDNLSKEVQTALTKNYKIDRATGYKMGDLRGAIIVDIKR